MHFENEFHLQIINMTQPQIAISYVDTFSKSIFLDFEKIVTAENLNLQIQARPAPGPMAAMEWLIPTAVIAYISKSYFDGFLKEMGKDHYALLKTGLKSLYTSLLGAKAPKVHLVGTTGKVSKEQDYSLLYSIVVEANPKLRFKLLLPANSTEEEYEDTVTEFLSFLEHFHSNTLDQATIDRFSVARPIGGTLLTKYNVKTGLIEAVDPQPPVTNV